jgi:DNA-binding NarL/FixJ family response regulator
MSTLPATEPPARDRPIQILVVEADPIVQSGLLTCLNRFADLQVAAEVETASSALRTLADRQQGTATFDLVVSGLPLHSEAGQSSGLGFCQQLKATYPTLPLLLLAFPQDSGLMSAFQMGVEGCCARGSSILDLVTAIRQVTAGQSSWVPEVLQGIPLAQPLPSRIATRAPQSFLLLGMRDRLRSSGLQQIEAALTQVNRELQLPQLSVLEQLVLTGSRRELKAARWLVKRLLPSSMPEAFSLAESDSRRITLPTAPVNTSRSVRELPQAVSPDAMTPKELQAQLFDCISAKLQSNLENLTPAPLEIDILCEEKKRELFYLILRQLEGLLDELRFSQVKSGQLPEKQAAILQDLWTSVTTDFFGRYYTLQVDHRDVEVVPVLLQSAAVVQTEILNKIPLVVDLLSHLLFQTPLITDNATYPIGTLEACDRALNVLENLTINVANAVIQPLLNQFADLETVKRGFYDRRLLSTRDIERFRNDLSWRYRIERYLSEPQAIFESRYRLLVFTTYGIQRISIYAPRRQELEQLTGLQYAVTLALETRDAITPRLQSAIAFIGSGIVYLLTEVIGRGIGLIGRGIVKGIGNVWQESKRSREG